MARNNKGSMYRPATEDTFNYIKKAMDDTGMSWNAVVHLLVRCGIRSVERENLASMADAFRADEAAER